MFSSMWACCNYKRIANTWLCSSPLSALLSSVFLQHISIMARVMSHWPGRFSEFALFHLFTGVLLFCIVFNLHPQVNVIWSTELQKGSNNIQEIFFFFSPLKNSFHPHYAGAVTTGWHRFHAVETCSGWTDGFINTRPHLQPLCSH